MDPVYSMDFLNDNDKYNPFSHHNFLFTDQISVNIDELKPIIDTISAYIIQLDLNGYDYIIVNEPAIYRNGHNFIDFFPKSCIDLSLKQIKEFLKTSRKKILYLKILYGIDEMHCIMFLVECVFDSYLNCDWSNVIYICVVSRNYEENIKTIV